jgi:hypothetical protein
MASPTPGDGGSKASGIAKKAVRAGSDLVERFRGDGSEPDARRSLTVGRSEEELRALWSDPARLGRVLAEPYTGDPSTWTAEVLDAAGDAIRFRGTSGQAEPLHAAGSVTFAEAPQDLGTVVTLELHLDGPDLAAGAAAFKALRRAKALAETGEIPTLAHNPSARTTDHESEA